jgi:hypothetical protein
VKIPVCVWVGVGGREFTVEMVRWNCFGVMVSVKVLRLIYVMYFFFFKSLFYEFYHYCILVLMLGMYEKEINCCFYVLFYG